MSGDSVGDNYELYDDYDYDVIDDYDGCGGCGGGGDGHARIALSDSPLWMS